MFRRNGRYDHWMKPWPPKHPVPLSAEGHRTVQMAAELARGATWQEVPRESPVLEKRRRAWLTRKIEATAPDLQDPADLGPGLRALRGDAPGRP